MKKGRAKGRRKLPFYKIHGAGNDILVFDSASLKLTAKQKPAFIRLFAHRQLGLGADQVLEILSRRPLRIQFWNCDGSTAEMCGNGSRAFLHLAVSEGWAKPGQKLPIWVGGRPFEGTPAGKGFAFSLGVPQVLGTDKIKIAGRSVPFTEVTVGNPHAVIKMRGKAGDWRAPRTFSYREFGPLVETHKRFPKKTNASFIYETKASGKEVKVRADIWERGAGATLSCGSGAVATAAALRSEYPRATRFRIRSEMFELTVDFKGDKAFLSGPTALVAEGWFSY